MKQTEPNGAEQLTGVLNVNFHIFNWQLFLLYRGGRYDQNIDLSNFISQ